MPNNNAPDTISELIKLLQSIQRSNGDLNVAVRMDGKTPISEVRVELIEYGQDEELVICGYGW